jgi:hypothetical protein
MDISRLTPEQLLRLTPEQRRGFTPEQRAAALAILDPVLQLTAEEQEQRDAALRLEDAETWTITVWRLITPIAESYERGDLTPLDVIALVHRISIACGPQERLQLLGRSALEMRRRHPRPRARGERRPQYSKCVRDVTAELVLLLKEQHPTERWSPTAYDKSSPLIDRALETLVVIGWFGDQPTPQPATVEDWVQALREERRSALAAPYRH